MMAADTIKQHPFNAMCADTPIIGKHRQINLAKSFNFDVNDKCNHNIMPF